MGDIKSPKPVQFFTSIIFRNNGYPENAERDISKIIGAILDRTPSMPFYHTDYYEKEMGNNLSRVFLLFEPLFQREKMPEIKLETNSIEAALSADGKRIVNIDPGYISLENIVLATTKGYAHRIYLGRGIFADLTLIYHNGTYNSLDWTYPDYGSGETIEMFKRWRSALKERVRVFENR